MNEGNLGNKSPLTPIHFLMHFLSRMKIFDISDIGDVRYDIDDNRYIADISVLDRYIVKISGMWHTRALV